MVTEGLFLLKYSGYTSFSSLLVSWAPLNNSYHICELSKFLLKDSFLLRIVSFFSLRLRILAYFLFYHFPGNRSSGISMEIWPSGSWRQIVNHHTALFVIYYHLRSRLWWNSLPGQMNSIKSMRNSKVTKWCAYFWRPQMY